MSVGDSRGRAETGGSVEVPVTPALGEGRRGGVVLVEVTGRGEQRRLRAGDDAVGDEEGLGELAVAEALRDQLAALVREAEVLPAGDSTAPVPADVGAAA